MDILTINLATYFLNHSHFKGPWKHIFLNQILTMSDGIQHEHIIFGFSGYFIWELLVRAVLFVSFGMLNS